MKGLTPIFEEQPQPHDSSKARVAVPLDRPLTIREAIDAFGPEAIPQWALASPNEYLIGWTGVDWQGRTYCVPGVSPSWLAAHTDYRVVQDRDTGHSKVMFRCPQCGALADHLAEHDPAVKHRRDR